MPRRMCLQALAGRCSVRRLALVAGGATAALWALARPYPCVAGDAEVGGSVNEQLRFCECGAQEVARPSKLFVFASVATGQESDKSQTLQLFLRTDSSFFLLKIKRILSIIKMLLIIGV